MKKEFYKILHQEILKGYPVIYSKGRILRTGPVFTLLILKATRFLFSKKNNLSTKMQLTNLPKFQQLAQIQRKNPG